MEDVAMKNRLDLVLDHIEEKYRNEISKDSRIYMEVSIGREAEDMGYRDLKEKYRDVYAVIPLKKALDGVKVRIDGRTFVNYVQFDSGIAAPGFIVKDSQLPSKKYIAKNSMICNFA